MKEIKIIPSLNPEITDTQGAQGARAGFVYEALKPLDNTRGHIICYNHDYGMSIIPLSQVTRIVQMGTNEEEWKDDDGCNLIYYKLPNEDVESFVTYVEMQVVGNTQGINFKLEDPQ